MRFGFAGRLHPAKGLVQIAQAVLAIPREVDFRVARRKVIADWRKGKLARNDVCDAHPELMRAARNIGRSTRRVCPVREACTVVAVAYAFGKRPPPAGTLPPTGPPCAPPAH